MHSLSLCNSVQSGDLHSVGFTSRSLTDLTVLGSVQSFGRECSFFFLYGRVTQHPIITPQAHQVHHWAGSEVGAQTRWDLSGPQPDSTPHPRLLHGHVTSSRHCCSSLCRHMMSSEQCWEGCQTCRTSAASHPAELRNSEEHKCDASF